MSIRQLSDDVAVCGQISPDDLETIAGFGFKTIVNNRPDHEVGEQLQHAAIAAKAKSLGLAVHYLPMEVGQPPAPRDQTKKGRGGEKASVTNTEVGLVPALRSAAVKGS